MFDILIAILFSIFDFIGLMIKMLFIYVTFWYKMLLLIIVPQCYYILCYFTSDFNAISQRFFIDWFVVSIATFFILINIIIHIIVKSNMKRIVLLIQKEECAKLELELVKKISNKKILPPIKNWNSKWW